MNYKRNYILLWFKAKIFIFLFCCVQFLNFDLIPTDDKKGVDRASTVIARDAHEGMALSSGCSKVPIKVLLNLFLWAKYQ